MSLGPKKTEKESKIGKSQCADNKLVFNLERKADKFPKSQLRLSLA